ncbi:MAG TPA: response regulator transcription factor [Amycolatopsis sp.]|uniref:response regulator transcription factor n=1 Tax=Amycolatopsis sp. TaxID=37632 RepID=UPI002B47E4F6|nr:response regulator transcription factor [Amycolatopsis sp.]HKS47306.1 response regulator transcription factor [Amycolatopsis sp.]
MVRVLLVDDDLSRTELISGQLRRGFSAWNLHTGMDAITAAPSADIVVLNLKLPDLDGVEVCRRIRAVSTVPMIGITAGSSEFERVLALRAGLDVCMAPTFGVSELVARIATLTRRNRPDRRAGKSMSYGDLVINTHTREVRMCGHPVGLTKKEFDLLYLLASRPGVTFDRKQILSAVWHDDNSWMQRSRTIDTHVNSIRRKLGCSEAIRTQRGVGFQFSSLDCVACIATPGRALNGEDVENARLG